MARSLPELRAALIIREEIEERQEALTELGGLLDEDPSIIRAILGANILPYLTAILVGKKGREPEIIDGTLLVMKSLIFGASHQIALTIGDNGGMDALGYALSHGPIGDVFVALQCIERLLKIEGYYNVKGRRSFTRIIRNHPGLRTKLNRVSRNWTDYEPEVRELATHLLAVIVLSP